MSTGFAFEAVSDAELWSLGGGNDGSFHQIIRDILSTTRALNIVSSTINNSVNINENNNTVTINNYCH